MNEMNSKMRVPMAGHYSFSLLHFLEITPRNTSMQVDSSTMNRKVIMMFQMRWTWMRVSGARTRAYMRANV